MWNKKYYNLHPSHKQTCDAELNSTETDISESKTIDNDDTNFKGEKLHKLNITDQDNMTGYDDNQLPFSR